MNDELPKQQEQSLNYFHLHTTFKCPANIQNILKFIKREIKRKVDVDKGKMRTKKSARAPIL